MLVKALFDDGLREVRVDLAEVDAPDQAHAADLKAAVERCDLFFEERSHHLALAAGLRLDVVFEEVVKGRGAGDKAELVAAEGAIVLAGLPAVQLLLEQHDGERHAHTADGFGHHDHIGHDTGTLKGEEGTGAAAADLHVVHDHQNIVFVAERAHALQKFVGERTDAALCLQRLHHDSRRLFGGGMVVVDQGLHVCKHIQALEHIRSRNVGHVAEGRAAAVARVHLGGQRQCAEGHAVEAAHKRKHISSAGFLSGELERRFDGVGAGGTAELDLVFEAARLNDLLFERLNKLTLGDRVHIQRVDDAVGGEIIHDLLLDIRIVVAVVHRACAAEKVDILCAVLIGEGGAHSVGEHLGKMSAIGADLRLIGFECACIHTHYLILMKL